MAGDRKRFKAAMDHAERFIKQGDWNKAVKAYRYALAEFPNNQAAIIGFGQATLSAGQVQIAQKAFQQALKLDPSNHQALRYMADIQERMGQLDVAAENYLRIGNIFSAQSNLEAAIEAWQQAIRLLPDHVDAHRNLAQALARQDQPRPAARQLLTLAGVYQRRNDNERAMRQIQDAQDLIGDDPGVMAAIESLQQAAPIQPDKISDTPPVEVDKSDPLFGLADFTEAFAEEESFEGEEDPFAIPDELRETPRVGLVETVQQNVLAELAGIIFEDDNDSAVFAATMSKDKINMLIVQAIDLQSRGNLVEAIKNYQQVVRAGAGRPALYFNLGFLYKEQGQFDKAAKMLRMSAQDNQYNIASNLVLGETYHAANELEPAIRHFVEAVKLVDLETVSDYKVPELLQHYETLIDNYLALNDKNKIVNFIITLSNFFSKPSWEDKVYQVRQRVDNVDDSTTMSLAEFLETPETEVVVTALSITSEYLKRNLLMTASEECLRAIQKAPSYLRLHTRLADILLKQDHTDQAITKYLSISKVYQMRNQPGQAISIYQKILRLAPMDVTVRSELIDLYTYRQDIDHALEQYLILADSYYQLAQVDRAIEKYNEALRLADSADQAVDSWKIKILSQIGDIYNQRFDWGRATAAFESLLKVNPADEHTQRQLVDLYFKQGKTNQAIEALDKLLVVYQRQGQSENILELLKEFVSTYPENMLLRQRLAVAFGQNGLKQEAIAEYDALGEMQLENGLRDQATQTIQAILALGPDDAEGYRRLLSKISGGVI